MQLIIDDVVAGRDKQRGAEIAAEQRDTNSNGQILYRQHGLGGVGWLLEAQTDTDAEYDLKANPPRSARVSSQCRQQTCTDRGEDHSRIAERVDVAQLADADARGHGQDDVGQDERQVVDARGQRRRALDGLEVVGDEVDEQVEGPGQEEGKPAGRPDGALSDDPGWDGGFVAKAPLQNTK